MELRTLFDYYGGDPEVNHLILDGSSRISETQASQRMTATTGSCWFGRISGAVRQYDIYGALLNEDGSLKDTDFLIFQSANDD